MGQSLLLKSMDLSVIKCESPFTFTVLQVVLYARVASLVGHLLPISMKTTHYFLDIVTHQIMGPRFS